MFRIFMALIVHTDMHIDALHCVKSSVLMRNSRNATVGRVYLLSRSVMGQLLLKSGSECIY